MFSALRKAMTYTQTTVSLPSPQKRITRTHSAPMPFSKEASGDFYDSTQINKIQNITEEKEKLQKALLQIIQSYSSSKDEIVKSNKLLTLKQLLENPLASDVLVNSNSAIGGTLLHEAVRQNQPDVIERLLDHLKKNDSSALQNSLMTYDSAGFTLLHQAVGHETVNPQTVQTILKYMNRQDISTIFSMPDTNGHNVIELALIKTQGVSKEEAKQRLKVLSLLLNLDKSRIGIKLVQESIQTGNLDNFHALLKAFFFSQNARKAFIAALTKPILTPNSENECSILHTLALRGDAKMNRALSKALLTTSEETSLRLDENGYKLLQAVAHIGKPDGLKALITTLLSKNSLEDFVNAILKPDPTAKPESQWNLLHTLALQGKAGMITELLRPLLKQKDQASLEVLWKQRDANGDTALHLYLRQLNQKLTRIGATTSSDGEGKAQKEQLSSEEIKRMKNLFALGADKVLYEPNAAISVANKDPKHVKHAEIRKQNLMLYGQPELKALAEQQQGQETEPIQTITEKAIIPLAQLHRLEKVHELKGKILNAIFPPEDETQTA